MNTIYRFLAQRQRAAAEGHGHLARSAGPAGLEPEARARSSELDQAVAVALNRLDPKVRAALVLTVFGGATPAEVARIEGCARATVYWRIHQARQQLKKELGDWL